jgi:hypothetical protein
MIYIFYSKILLYKTMMPADGGVFGTLRYISLAGVFISRVCVDNQICPCRGFVLIWWLESWKKEKQWIDWVVRRKHTYHTSG